MIRPANFSITASQSHADAYFELFKAAVMKAPPSTRRSYQDNVAVIADAVVRTTASSEPQLIE